MHLEVIKLDLDIRRLQIYLVRVAFAIAIV